MAGAAGPAATTSIGVASGSSQGSAHGLTIFLGAVVAALVVELAPPPQGQTQLDPGALQMKIEGHQGQPLLGHPHLQTIDFPPPCQHPAGPQGFMVEIAAGLLMGGDVNVMEPKLPVPDEAEAVPQIGLACTNGLHLGAQQFKTGLQGFQDVVLMAGEAVVRQHGRSARPAFGASCGLAFGHGVSTAPVLCLLPMLAMGKGYEGT